MQLVIMFVIFFSGYVVKARNEAGKIKRNITIIDRKRTFLVNLKINFLKDLLVQFR